MNRIREHSSPETAEAALGVIRRIPNPTIRLIASEIGVGRMTACRAVARLVDEGRIRVIRKGTGEGYPTAYEVL